MALRVGQARQNLLIHICEQIRQAAESQTLLGACGTRSQDGEAGGPGLVNRGLPDRGLADAGVAFEHEPGRPAPGTLHESFDRREFGPAADDLVRHGKPPLM